jgi:pyrroline-5-carboxylate reductase
MVQSWTVVVGGGKMGEALVTGLRATGRDGVAVVETDPDRRDQLIAKHPLLVVVAGVASAPAPIDGAVIAVKPPDVEAVCRELEAAAVKRILSIAAGVTIGSLQGWAPGAAVLRAMPNTPALIRAGASALARGRGVNDEDAAWARGVLEAAGTVVELPEKALDAVTGLSGSGPAYVFLLAEALIDAGVLVGLARPVARDLAVQTVLGSARLLAETGDEPASLRAAVTSPGGTTAAGLKALESAGLRSAVLDAVSAATERARELGRTPAD